MKCPECHEDYTPDNPCSCHAPLRIPPVQPGPLHVFTEDETLPAMAPTGLDNPFWKI
ncbi:MAG: hypothetical protein LAO06_08170 [Acidobacteriia bacterium]|nr:hypothetical protein [Terriglobia bacterium]